MRTVCANVKSSAAAATQVDALAAAANLSLAHRVLAKAHSATAAKAATLNVRRSMYARSTHSRASTSTAHATQATSSKLPTAGPAARGGAISPAASGTTGTGSRRYCGSIARAITRTSAPPKAIRVSHGRQSRCFRSKSASVKVRPC